MSPAFTGPVDIVVRQHDVPICGGDCNYPVYQAAAPIPRAFPAASQTPQSYIVPDSGHNVNALYEAQQEFSQINKFLHNIGL